MNVKTLLIDGNNTVWRTAMSLPELTTPRGESVQVVYGFIRLLRDMVETFHPRKTIICWDEGVPAYRLSIYPSYKQHRQRKRDEASNADRLMRKRVITQMAVLKEEILPLLGIYQIGVANTEADDIIAAASQLKNLGLKLIVSGDKDMYQLVRKGVRVWSPTKQLLLTCKNFYHCIGMTPDEWLEYCILTGDITGDGIPPAARGLGEKTAAELVKRFSTIDNMLAHSKTIGQMGFRQRKLFQPGVLEQINLNRLLTDLRNVHAKESLQIEIAHRIRKEKNVDIVSTKQVFIQRAFTSLLSNFNVWIAPFRKSIRE